MTTLLQIENLRKAYGTKILFENADAVFASGQKVGVIGRNGAGKSTLCRMITGQEDPDSGRITRASSLRLSYLRQDEPYGEGETVIAFLRRYTGREEWECAKVAGKFQLKNEILEAPIGNLPGGFRTRVKLASMLVTEPNFMILDEPTNYLDLSTLILLEKFLAEYSEGFLVVSHDREFLKRTCEETLEIEDGEMTLYPGGVEEYLEYKESLREQAALHNARVETKRRQLERFVDRFRAKASKATQAKSKLKQIARLRTIEIAHPMSNVRIRIPQVERKKGMAFECRELTVGYPERTIASGVTVQIDRGDRVAILGDNGQGKTTFLRTIAGDLAVKTGTYRWGHGITVGYYAQHVFSALNPDHTILDSLAAEADPGVTRQDILNLAGNFLFQGEDVRKKIRVLSGGELARVCLAGLLLRRCSALLLDEPTNHLDFETVEILGNSLRDFHGTLLFISHDRTFANLLATRILTVRDGSIVSYPGSYEDYVYKLTTETTTLNTNEKDAVDGAADPAGDEKDAWQRRKELQSEIAKSKRDLNRINQTISTLKKEKDEIEDHFAKNGWSKRRNDRLIELKASLEQEEARWLELSISIDEMTKQVLVG